VRTTIDLPDSLYREAKATAASRGIKLKEFVTNALRAALRSQQEGMAPDDLHRQRMSEHFRRMDEGKVQQEPVGKFDRESLHDRDA
jgi:hypothetical protein